MIQSDVWTTTSVLTNDVMLLASVMSVQCDEAHDVEKIDLIRVLRKYAHHDDAASVLVVAQSYMSVRSMTVLQMALLSGHYSH